jgi:hypothetical protein
MTICHLGLETFMPRLVDIGTRMLWTCVGLQQETFDDPPEPSDMSDTAGGLVVSHVRSMYGDIGIFAVSITLGLLAATALSWARHRDHREGLTTS